jgi:hypothetical protein
LDEPGRRCPAWVWGDPTSADLTSPPEFALSHPASVVITGIDSPQMLDQALRIGKTFRPLPAQEISAILSKTAKAASQGEYELFKTSSHFDSTAQHPQWLGSETARVKELAPPD